MISTREQIAAALRAELRRRERLAALEAEYRAALLWLYSQPQYRRIVELEGAIRELEGLGAFPTVGNGDAPGG